LNSFELSGFRSRQERITGQLKTLAEVARGLAVESLALELDNTRREMLKDTFRFVVVGEFSRGKSTVINALLRDRVLPSSVEPTTTVLTKVAGGKSKSFNLLHRDGRADQEITFEQFCELVAPFQPRRSDREQCQRYEERLKELRNLSMVEISCTAPICNEGVEIIDTPGTNDLDPLREQITYDYIPRADAILFILSAKTPFTKSESDFLINRVLKADVARIFFLLNFSDTLSKKDLETVRHKCITDLENIVEQPRLFPVSARKALRSRLGVADASVSSDDGDGFRELESALSIFLQSDRAFAKLSRPIYRGVRFCDEILTGPLAFAKASVGLDIPEIQEKIGKLTPQIQQLRQRRDHTIASLRLRLDNKRRELAAILQRGLYRVADAALAAIDSYSGPFQAEEIGRYMEGHVAPIQSDLQTSFKSAATEAFANEFSKSNQNLADIEAELSTVFKSKLDTDLTRYDPQLSISVIQAGSSGLFQLGAAGLGLGAAGLGLFAFPLLIPFAVGWLWAIISDFFSESSAKQEQLGKVRISIDERYRGTIPSTIGQFEKSWNDAVQEALSELSNSFERRCNEANNALVSALDKLRSATQSAAEMKSDIERIENRLHEVKQSLMSEGSFE